MIIPIPISISTNNSNNTPIPPQINIPLSILLIIALLGIASYLVYIILDLSKGDKEDKMMGMFLGMITFPPIIIILILLFCKLFMI